MRKSVVIGVLVAFFFGFLLLPTLYAGLTTQHEGEYQEGMMLYPPKEYEAETPWGPTPFDHDVHAEFECEKCHHLGEVDQGCMEAGCHDVANKDELGDRDEVYYFEEAYHQMCMEGCHEEHEAAPVSCDGCHEM